MKRACLVLSGVLSVLCLFGAALAANQAAPAARSPLSEEVFKNIQVLKGMPVDQFMGTMSFFSSSTGMNCTDCHTSESGGNWALYATDTPLKQRARVMVVMMNTINRTNFGGRQVVTCFTCHRGNTRPSVMPSLDGLYGEPPPDEPGDPFEQAPRRPAPEQVLDKYIAALGGAQRVAALTSFTARGTYIGFDDADKVPVEIFAKAPAQRTTIVHGLLGNTTTTFDGREGWIAAPPTDRPVPLIMITGQDLEGVEVETSMLFPSQIEQLLAKWRTGTPMFFGEREIVAVQGDTPGGGVVTLCFDAQSGLLARLVRYADSPVGRLVTRVDYDDYRDIAGVKLPFRWTVRWESGRSTFELTELQPNVQIPATRFARPAQ